MKQKIKNLSRIIASGIALVVVFGVSIQTASAAYSLNTASNDCRTFTVANHTTQEGYGNPCWTGTNISVDDGEILNLAVYFHNSGDTAVSNVSVRVSDMRGTHSGKKEVVGQLYVNGVAVPGANGSAYITFPANATVTFDGAYIQTQSSPSFRSLSGGTDIFSIDGINIGTVAPGWSNQGVVKAVFRVSSDGGSNNGDISVSTDDVDILDEDRGDVRFYGSYVSSDSSVSTYFEYRGERTGMTSQIRRNASAGNFNETVSGLPSGNYEYRACASSASGEDCGDWENFSIGDNTTSDSLDVTTNSPDIIDEDRGNVVFNGNYEGNEDGNADTYFEYRKEGGSTKTTSGDSYSSRSRSFDQLVTGLSEGDYEYRACVKNDSDEDCGSWRSFSIDRSNNDDDDEDLPSVQTLKPFQVLNDFATLDGSYDMNGCSGSTWFEYGTTQSMTSRSNKVSRSSNASGYMTQSITSLSPNTVYYYRAVAENCQGTTRGSTYSFTTTRNSVIVNPVNPVRPVTPVVNVGGGARYVRLTIDNGRDSVMKGDELVYDVTWENITKLDLKNLVLEVAFPEGLQLVSTDRGQMDRAANTVYVNINELEAFEKDDMTIRARVIGANTIRDNDSITARAIIAFENPENNKAQENAIAYDSDSYYIDQTNVLGASIFGLGFLPGTLAGWLFLVLLLILVILIIRYAIRREEHHHYHGAPSTEGTSVTTTKVVTEEEYTPYRPTPKE